MEVKDFKESSLLGSSLKITFKEHFIYNKEKTNYFCYGINKANQNSHLIKFNSFLLGMRTMVFDV